MIVLKARLESPEKPKVEEFDRTRRRSGDPNSPFFEIKEPNYSECNHRHRGFILDTTRRMAVCKCGVDVHPFDALVIYAQAERRLQNQADIIESHRKREEEKRAKHKHYHRTVSAVATPDGSGYIVQLDCGHKQAWYKRTPPRGISCGICLSEEKR